MSKLTTRQTLLRTLFMLAAIVLVCWFLPHNETFRYEYEVGKPWRYGRLTAPYDFPIYLSDSAIVQMEDSLRAQIVPRYTVRAGVQAKSLSEVQALRTRLSSDAYQHLLRLLERTYQAGIITGEERARLDRYGLPSALLLTEDEESPVTVPSAQLRSERQAYEQLRSDSLHGREYAPFALQRYVVANLELDTTALRIEYARLRQQISSTSGLVLAESRIIDQGEIVTPHTYDVLESYRREQQQRMTLGASDTMVALGRLLLVALVLCSVLLFFGLYRPWIYASQNEVFVAVGAIVLMAVLTSLAHRFAVGAVYLVPIGIVTILLSTFHGSRSAYYCHIIMVLLCSFIAPSHFEYLIIQSIIGMIIVFSLKDGLQERSQLLKVCIFTAIGYPGIYLLYTLANEGTLVNVSWPILLMMEVNAILLLISYILIEAMEYVFGFMSGVTLVELCNLGKGLLLRLSREASGTFQHSINVANIAANAASACGANPQLVRTGALYHDIGKLRDPQAFTENQPVGVNRHEQLSVEESVELIKRHVTDGVAMAREAKLPNEIIAFIQTHHGCSQVKYFYIKWCNEHPDQTPDLQFFSYAGPDPVTKEQCILMMADSIEAASKSLREVTPQKLSTLVDGIIRDMINSGRFNNAKITFLEIDQCRQSFVHDLEAIYRNRIEYPTLQAH